jgi:hypothetical protein
MRRLQDYIFSTTQVEHEKLGEWGFQQGEIKQNNFLHIEGETFVAGFLTKSCINLITVNPWLTHLAPLPPLKEQFVFNTEVPEDDLFSITLIQKPIDYISKVECIGSDIVKNSFMKIGNNNVEFILAQNDKCYVFRLPTDLIFVN